MKEKMEDIRNNKISPGYKRTSEGIIPVDWDFVQLQEVVRVFRGASPRPKGDPRYYGGNIPRVLIEDVTRDGKYVYPCIDSLTEEGAKKSRLLPKGSVVLSCSGTRVAIPGILAIPACIHDGFFGFDDYKELAPEYLYYFFSLLHEKMQSSATTGGVFNNLTTQIMKEMYIHLPPQKEQVEIVKILNQWDKAIELKEKLIEQKKEQRKGLMQKLLTSEVRLPGFSDKWEKKKIGELLEESKVIAKDPQLDKRITVRLNLKGVCKREISTVEKEGATTQYTRKEGQFIYGKQNLHKGAFGLIPKELDGFQSSSDIPCFDFKEGVDSLWFYYYFSRESFYTNLENISSGTGSKRIQPKELYKLTIKLPSLKEQQRQSKILECSDKEIYLLEKELETYREQKQRLMQLLLTGKVRVKV